MFRRRLLAILTVMSLTGACGPIAYVNEVTRRASSAVDVAREAEADKYAPYWWTRATLYLHKAREIAAHADYQGATRFGRLATEAAEQAASDAALAKADPSKRPLDLTAPIAPAKDWAIAPAPAPTGIAPAKDAP